LKNDVFNLGITGTQRIESLHQKVKDVVKKNAEIVTFFSKMVTFLEGHHREATHKVIDAMNRRPVKRPRPDSDHAQYFDVLTPYAYRLLEKQLHASSAIAVTPDGSYKSHEGTLHVTATSCDCSFRKTTRLPCRHILAFRQQHGYALYSADLVPTRWSQNAWRRTLTARNSTDGTSVVTTHVPRHRTTVLTETQKYRAAHPIVMDILQTLSQSGALLFNKRLQQLTFLSQQWKQDIDVSMHCKHSSYTIVLCIPVKLTE